MEKPIFLYNTTFLTPPPSGKAFSEQYSLLKGFECICEKKDFSVAPLIRWGSTVGSDNRTCTLNRKRALMNVLDRRTTYNIFKLNRLRQPRMVQLGSNTSFPVVAEADFFVERITTLKDYRVWVFDAKVFHVEKRVSLISSSTKFKGNSKPHYEPIPINLDEDTKKVCQLAIKATHLLGLDFLFLEISIDHRNRPVILKVSPVFPLVGEPAKKFFDLILNHLKKLHENSPEPKVVLGADPEFILRNSLSGALVYPSNFLRKEGLAGYDERSERRQGRLYPLAEIRPAPDLCPLHLTVKIKYALKYTLSRIPYKNIEWLAGSLHFGRYQIGGHIHYTGRDLSSALLRVLDNYLAIPVMLIEDPQAAALRRKQYGGLGNIRLKPHGGFEYRTLGSWLISPEITRAILCLAKIVVTEYRSLSRDFFMNFEMQKAFYESNRQYFQKIFHLLWNDIKGRPGYSRYENELQIFPKMISRQETWNEQMDIRKAWHLDIPADNFLNPSPRDRIPKP